MSDKLPSQDEGQELDPKQRIVELLRRSTRPLNALEIRDVLGTDLNYAWFDSYLKELEKEGRIVWDEVRKGWHLK